MNPTVIRYGMLDLPIPRRKLLRIINRKMAYKCLNIIGLYLYHYRKAYR